MRFGWGKLVILLVMSVAVLQIVHMLLLSRLEVKEAGSAQKRADEPGSRPPEGTAAAADADDLRAMVSAVQGSSVLDSSGEFKIVNFVAQADSLKQQRNGYEDVTLVTQCSSEHLGHLDALSRRWDGPVSVTVFATKEDLPDTLLAVAELRRCLAAVRYNTSFHLVYPLSHHRQQDLRDMVAKATINNKGSGDGECPPPAEANGPQPANSAPNYGRATSPYPANLLRNVARRNALTEFVFVVDVDTLPNEGLHRDFMRFAAANHLFSDSKKDDKTTYVVPAFEARELVDVPRDKTALLRLVDQMQARPFYFELCWKCQKHTDYDAWQREPLAPRLDVIFEVLWKDPWEPFYIGRNTGPLYDERFKQYGFNRISQVCELHIAGYKFSVLNNAFLIHRGLKTMDSFHKKKDEDQERNRLLFRQFKAELKEKYPDSSRRCY